MKTNNRYSIFVLYANAPVCVYGNKTVRAPYTGCRVKFVFRLRKILHKPVK